MTTSYQSKLDDFVVGLEEPPSLQPLKIPVLQVRLPHCMRQTSNFLAPILSRNDDIIQKRSGFKQQKWVFHEQIILVYRDPQSKLLFDFS